MKRKYHPYVSIGSLVALSACNTSPVQSIVGSYFPAWMLCAVFGILLTVIVYVIFVKINIDEYIPAKLLIYLGLAISLTFISWLLLFGN
jgi:YtcA family